MGQVPLSYSVEVFRKICICVRENPPGLVRVDIGLLHRNKFRSTAVNYNYKSLLYRFSPRATY